MNEELIIDGRRVDMSPDTRIVLNFKSNLLGDISKISASNSQTIGRYSTTQPPRRITRRSGTGNTPPNIRAMA